MIGLGSDKNLKQTTQHFMFKIQNKIILVSIMGQFLNVLAFNYSNYHSLSKTLSWVTWYWLWLRPKVLGSIVLSFDEVMILVVWNFNQVWHHYIVSIGWPQIKPWTIPFINCPCCFKLKSFQENLFLTDMWGKVFYSYFILELFSGDLFFDKLWVLGFTIFATNASFLHVIANLQI